MGSESTTFFELPPSCLDFQKSKFVLFKKIDQRNNSVSLELRRELLTLRRVAASISSYNKDEELNKETFKERLLEKLRQSSGPSDLEKAYNENLRDLEDQYPIRNKVLLIKSVGILLFVISVFFLHSIPEMSKKSMQR